jgi:hypothetical protein
MRSSKFVRIDPNILIEYIYDDGNLISEPYSIVFNTNTNVYSFLSSIPETNNYLAQKTVIQNGSSVSKLFTNQLVKLDTVQGQWGKLDLNTYTFIQKRDYGISIPIRYDKIRVWFPTNYVFEGYKGFHLRVFTLDFDNIKFVDLSNYFFNISDVNQIEEMDYANPPLYQSEMNWGKYIQIQFPSVTKVSDQRRLNITRENTINFNLTEGKGLSKTAPVFLDFLFIESVQNVNSNTYFKLVDKRSLSVPQTPEFEKFGVVVEPSTQGDFFLIYPIFNGSIGEFNQFIEESFVFGNRYYLDYTIDIYEKNIKTKTQRIIVTEDFIQEIEFRPIFKYTTTTAIIEVTCKLIDAVDNTEVIRKASYGLLQDKVSDYSRYLSKINLTKANKVNVYKIKGISTPNLDINNSNSIKSSLKINPISYTVYSKSYNIVLSNTNANFDNSIWLANRQSQIVIFPFDNIIQFKILTPDISNTFAYSDLTQYDDIELTIRNDKKGITFEIFKDVENNLEGGEVSFKILEDKYLELKKIFTSGSNTFYINGKISGNKMSIYTGQFLPWDFKDNITNLETKFTANLKKPTIKNTIKLKIDESVLIQEVKSKIEASENIQTSTNTTEIRNVDKKVLGQMNQEDPQKILDEIISKITMMWKPYWMGDFNIMVRSYNYQFETNVSNLTNKYVLPSNLRSFTIQMKDLGIISDVVSNKNTGQLSPATQAEVDLILGYFKMFNFNPSDVSIQQFVSINISDLKSYLKNSDPRPKPQSQVVSGSNVPTKEAFELINTYLATKLQFQVNPTYRKSTSNDKKINKE